MKKFKVNENCISCGACTAIAPDVFEFNDDMLAEAIEGKNIIDEMNDETKEQAIDALEGCPVGAIELVEVNCECNHNCNCEDNCGCSDECDCSGNCNCGDDCNCNDDCRCNEDCDCHKKEA